jgi:methylated-DNA-[protein]-cysteine S-methyltransferase
MKTNKRHAQVETELGTLTVVAADGFVVGVYFPGHWTMPPRDALGVRVDPHDDVLIEATWTQLRQYIAGERTEFELPTAMSGDSFEQRVWGLLKQIPYGETTTYGEIAATLGDPRMARAVGRAVGRNPLSIIVGCHRVIGSDGSLTGYAGGLERKRRLLDLEAPALRWSKAEGF